MSRRAADSMRGGERMAEGEPERDWQAVFVALMATHEAPIARYLRHLVGDPEVARDLTQDTFLAAYRALPRTDLANPGGWLHRIATNQALAYFRRRKLIAWIPLAQWFVGGREPRVAGPAEQVATDAAVAAALARLTPRHRACLLLSVAGFSSVEIAAQLGASPTAARMCLSRARESFRRHYYGDDETEE